MDNILISKEISSTSSKTLTKKQYLKKLYDIKNMSLPVAINECKENFSCDRKALEFAHSYFLDQLGTYILVIESMTCLKDSDSDAVNNITASKEIIKNIINPFTLDEYLDELHDLKNTPLPSVVLGRMGGGMSFDIKVLTVEQYMFLNQLDTFMDLLKFFKNKITN